MMAEDVRSDEPIALSVADAEPNIVPATEAAAIVQNVPKKRGRKPKIANATEDSSQMGRPPLARDALMISPCVTGSLRIRK